MYSKSNQFGNIMSGVGSAVGKVGGYFGNIAREVRDVPTAVGTTAWESFDRSTSRPGFNQTQLNNSVKAGNNMTTQLKEVAKSVIGQRGTRSDKYNNTTGAYEKAPSRTPTSGKGPKNVVARPVKPKP